MVVSTEKATIRNEVATLLASSNASENCEGIGMILSGNAIASDHEKALLSLEQSKKKAPLYMTVGDLASIALDVFGIKRYQGNKDRVLRYIAQLSS